MSPSSQTTAHGLLSLSEKEQRHKLRKRQLIEKHWGCTIESVLPKAIWPREMGSGPSHGGRPKAKIGEQYCLAEWWRWSGDLYTKLENLAAMTPGRLPFAQALMQAEVSQRQQDYTNNNREVAELLKSDLERIVAELRSRKEMGAYESDESDEEKEENEEDEPARDDSEEKEEEGTDLEVDDLDGATGEKVKNEQLKAKEHTESMLAANIDINGIGRQMKIEPNTPKSVKRERTNDDDEKLQTKHRQIAPPQILPSKKVLDLKANIASLRAAAARLHRQASQREAKAYKLEAELFEKEAGE